MPFIFVTNGGGTPESKKKFILEREFPGLDFLEKDVVTSHSPMRNVISEIRDDQTVLLVNKNDNYSRAIADSYGIKNYILISEYSMNNPLLCPWNDYDNKEEGVKNPKISIILVLHEPCDDWGGSLQILVDVLRSDGEIGPRGYDPIDNQVVPIYFANPDFVYMSHYGQPRFTQGAFIMCLEALFKRTSGRDLKYTIFGKPYLETYNYAKELLTEKSETELSKIYCIGDNPASDIAGANNAGSEYISILVKTGIFQGDENDKEHPADYIFEDVLEAINWIITQHI